MKENSSRGLIKGLHRILAKTHIKMLKDIESEIVRFGPVVIRLLIRSHNVPRDSSSSCLKFRTSFRRLTTLEIGKKHKQNLEHSVS